MEAPLIRTWRIEGPGANERGRAKAVGGVSKDDDSWSPWSARGRRGRGVVLVRAGISRADRWNGCCGKRARPHSHREPTHDSATLIPHPDPPTQHEKRRGRPPTGPCPRFLASSSSVLDRAPSRYANQERLRGGADALGWLASPSTPSWRRGGCDSRRLLTSLSSAARAPANETICPAPAGAPGSRDRAPKPRLMRYFTITIRASAWCWPSLRRAK